MYRELAQTRDLLSVAGQATAELSLAHTLETVVSRVPDLLDVDAVGVYLREEGRLDTAAARGVTGPHAIVAERLLGLALGPFRARGLVTSADVRRDTRLESVHAAAAEAGIEAAQAAPLIAHGDVIGLLVVYPPRGSILTADRSALLAALAGQIAAAVQNARLHEETKQLGAEREQALAAERTAARRLSSLYEISRSFAHSLSLDRTLDALGRTLVELLDVDAAVIRLPGRAWGGADRPARFTSPIRGCRRLLRRCSGCPSASRRPRPAGRSHRASRCGWTPRRLRSSDGITTCSSRSSRAGRRPPSCRSQPPRSCSPR